MEYFVDRSLLADNKTIRRQFLDKYFSLDLIGFEECLGDRWKLTTFTPDQAEYYIDPNLSYTLMHWSEAVPFNELSLYKRFYKNCLISFVDSWSLYYWSFCLSFLQEKYTKMPQIELFHVDDHKDHDTPLLFKEGGSYHSLLSDHCIKLWNPASVATAIQEKAVSMGSFISLLIHEIESMNIFHLKLSALQKVEELRLHATFERDKLLLPESQRPSISLLPLSSAGENYRYYYLSSSPEKLIEKVGQESKIVFLHIDCDAFNNRFNGNSQWTLCTPSIELNIKQIKKEIDRLLETISQISAKIYLNIALSPGFFPAEYWKETLSYLLLKGEEYGIIQEDDFSAYLKNMHPEEVLNGICT